MWTSRQGKAFLIAIEKSTIEAEIAKLVGRSLPESVVFEVAIDLTKEDLRCHLQQFIQFLWQMGSDPEVASRLVLEELEQAFLACLVKSLPHNYSEAILRQGG
jgi:hypothetical protein